MKTNCVSFPAAASAARVVLRRSAAWQVCCALLFALLLLGGVQRGLAQTFVAEWAVPDIGRLGPTGMAVETTGAVTYLYVADETNGRIIKFNAATGARAAVWGETGNGDGQFNRPYGIAVDPVSHDLFIAERGNSRVQRITNNGTYVMKWGFPGAADGQFNSPIGIAIDAAGNVYVSDYGNHRVQKFRVSGTNVQHVRTWGSMGSGNGQFRGPYGLTLDSSGNIWVADTHNGRLQKFNSNGDFLATVGSPGTGNGQFVTPMWVTFDADGNYYVAETNTDPSTTTSADISHQRIQKFGASGAFLSKFGSYGEAGGQFRLPMTIAVSGNDAFVSDYYNTRVQKFSLSGSGPSGPTGPGSGSGGRFVNLSSRLSTADGDANRAFIAGFVVTGTAPKPMLIRAIGPGLDQFGVTGTLANPKLRIIRDGQTVAENEDWAGNAAVASASGSVGAFPLGNSSRDAALVVSLAPGNYSAQVMTNGGSGVALVEVYDADTGQPSTQLVNLSTRGFVDTGSGALMAGFVVSGDQPKRVLVRGIGPALAAFGVGGALNDAVVKVYKGDVLVAQNDDWSTPQAVSGGAAPATAAEISAAAGATGAFGLTAGSKDAAVLITLQPGAYNAVISGANGTTGAGLVEVYQLSN